MGTSLASDGSVEHGRGHDERMQKHLEEPKRANRANNTPPDLDEELEFGPRHGSEPAPTEQAARREAERHRLEREMGHHAAGTDGYVAQTEDEPVSREKLEAAARQADAAVRKRL
jgi:hypothetical protein